MKPRIARFGLDQLLFGPMPRTTPPLVRNFFSSHRLAQQLQQRHALSLRSLHQYSCRLLGHRPSLLTRRFRSLRFKTDKAHPSSPQLNPTPHLGSPQPAPSLSQRLKQLSREYGWSAVGVYFALSVLDFPFCFLAVRLLGTDRIGHYEHVIKGAFWSVVRMAFPDAGKPSNDGTEDAAAAAAREASQDAAAVAARADACKETRCCLLYP